MDKPKQIVVTFTPTLHPITLTLDGTTGSELARVYREQLLANRKREGGNPAQQNILIGRHDIELAFIEGLVAARVFHSAELLKMVKTSQVVTVSFSEEEKE